MTTWSRDVHAVDGNNSASRKGGNDREYRHFLEVILANCFPIKHLSKFPGKSRLRPRRRHLHIAMLFLEIWTTPWSPTEIQGHVQHKFRRRKRNIKTADVNILTKEEGEEEEEETTNGGETGWMWFVS